MSGRAFAAWLREAAWLVVFFAVAAGLGDLFVLGGRKLFFGRWAYLGPQVVWLSSLSYLLVLSVAAVPLVLVRAGAPVLVFVLSLLAVAGPITILHPWLATWAVAILALGAAVRLAFTARTHRERATAAVRRAVPVMVALVALLAVAVNVRGLVVSRQAERRLAVRPPRDAPNVLLVILDAVRAPSLSAYGYVERTSPALERLAAGGVRFDRAFSPSSWTIPSHAAYFTGRPPHELSADWDTPLDRRDSTLAEIFRARGWRAAGFTGNTAMMIGESGLGRGFHPYDYQHISLPNILFHGGLVRFVTNNRVLRRVVNDYRQLQRRWGERVVAEFLDWQARHADRPFFAMINIYDAHEPYTAPAPLQRRFAAGVRWPGLVDRIRNRGEPGRISFHAADSADQRALYHASVAQADAALGLLLDSLEGRGLLGQTVVIVSSDHGEEFYEHGEWGHSQTLYHMALRVPLVVSWPRLVPAGRVVEQPVEARLLTVTLLELAGIRDAPLRAPGLARYWTGAPGAADTVVSSLTAPRVKARAGAAGRAWSLVAGDLHFIRGFDRSAKLFNYVADPDEHRDLARDTAWAGAVTAFNRVVSRLDTP